jgi:hypothetical protein
MNQYEGKAAAAAAATFVFQLPLQRSAQWFVFLVNNELALYGVSHYFFLLSLLFMYRLLPD